MRIEDKNGAEIVDIEGWAKLYDNPEQRHHWKEHRSAYSAADFILNQEGAEAIRSRVASTIGKDIRLDRIVPEYEVRFDEFGKGRMHDLGIFGKADSGESLFIGVEAKVDESFGDSVRDAYLKAKARQITGASTNAPERIEGLLGMHFSTGDASMFDIRYQLLYATAGTVAVKKDISVLYVIVFKTSLYDEARGDQNYQDYIQFMSKVGAEPLDLPNQEAVGHELILQEKKLVCLYEYFDL
jgi:hypothetical protein